MVVFSEAWSKYPERATVEAVKDSLSEVNWGMRNSQDCVGSLGGNDESLVKKLGNSPITPW